MSQNFQRGESVVSPHLMSIGVEHTGFNKASTMSCVLGLTNTIIGAGILGIPYAFSRAGWVLGTVLLLLCSFLSLIGLALLSSCSLQTGRPSSFFTLASSTVPSFAQAIDAAVVLNSLGITVAYLQIIGDSTPAAFAALSFPFILQSRYFCISLFFIIISILSMKASLDALNSTSTLSIIVIFFLVLVVVSYSLNLPQLDPCGGDQHQDSSNNNNNSSSSSSGDDHCVGNFALTTVTLDTLKVFPVFIFCFSCQQNTFAVVNELHNPTHHRVNKVFCYSIGCAFTLYVLVAFCGYHTFGDLVQPDILSMYPSNWVLATCRLLISAVMACHYPIQLHAGRQSALSLYKAYMGVISTQAAPDWVFYIVTTIYLGVSLIIALSFNDLSKAFAFVGATGGTLVTFIFPGFFYWHLHATASPADSNAALSVITASNTIQKGTPVKGPIYGKIESDNRDGDCFRDYECNDDDHTSSHHMNVLVSSISHTSRTGSDESSQTRNVRSIYGNGGSNCASRLALSFLLIGLTIVPLCLVAIFY